MIEEEKGTNKELIYVLAVVGILSIGLLFYVTYGTEAIEGYIETEREFELTEFESQNEYECEMFIEEGRFLVNKYHPITNTTLWESEDREKINSLSEQVVMKCTITADDIVGDDFNQCYDIYYSIRVLLNKMTDMEIQSLEQSDQDLYYEKYAQYHKNNCDLVKPEMEVIFDSTWEEATKEPFYIVPSLGDE